MAALPSRPCCGVLLLLLVLILLVVSRRQTGAAGRTDVPDLDRVVLRPASPLRPMPVAAASQPSSARSGSSACGRRAGTNHSASDVFEMAFYINAEGSLRRQKFMEDQLCSSGVAFERWPAIHGAPSLLQTHARYFNRGVHLHLYLNHSRNSTLSGWGTIGTYLSHMLLIEHVVQRWRHRGSAAILILQDDTLLAPDWLFRVRAALAHTGPDWDRFLLVWWGLAREADCDTHVCVVKPPAGPTEAGPDCCGKRYYHGLQAWLVRVRSLRCLRRRLRRRPIKNIDALMVNCGCPRTYALRPEKKIGEHLDRKMGSERAAVNDVWRANLTQSTLSRSALRNMRKSWGPVDQGAKRGPTNEGGGQMAVESGRRGGGSGNRGS